MSDSLGVSFGRALLAQVMPDVRAHTTAEQRKKAWTYNFGRGHWEFHGPDEFYWHGSADNAYDARFHGWHAWLRWKGFEAEERGSEAIAPQSNQGRAVTKHGRTFHTRSAK